MTTIHVVEVTLLEGGDPIEEVFLFEDPAEAMKFVDHMQDLYNKHATFYTDGTLDYDKAIERVVEMIGPSDG